MTIAESVRDVTIKLATTLPPAFTFVILLFVGTDIVMLWLMHDLQLERIRAVTSIFQACTTALSKQ